VPSPRTQAEALVVLTWKQESVILSDSVKKAILGHKGALDKILCVKVAAVLFLFGCEFNILLILPLFPTVGAIADSCSYWGISDNRGLE